MDQGNNGLSRGDRNRNARLAALRAAVARDHAESGVLTLPSRGRRLSWLIMIRG